MIGSLARLLFHILIIVLLLCYVKLFRRSGVRNSDPVSDLKFPLSHLQYDHPVDIVRFDGIIKRGVCAKK